MSAGPAPIPPGAHDGPVANCGFFFCLEIHKLACRVQPKLTQVETQYWGNPKVSRLKGTPAIHVTCLYISWYVRVVDTHSILK